MINRVVLMGRLVSDPELKQTANGVSVTSFRIAVERNFVKPGEQRQADFIDIVAWRQTAEFVCRFFGKGAMIAVDGSIQTRTYQAKDGTNRYVVEVVADQVSFTGEKREQSRSYNSPAGSPFPEPESQVAPSFSNGSDSDFTEMPSDDDLPF
ncbi:MAG: single-stranded DNA-binding protein [Acutalibacteraceae bacterium]